MIIFDAIYMLASLYCISIVFYLFAVTVAAYFFRKKTGTVTIPPKIAVVVPAHNEELSIKKTVREICRSRYERSNYSVMVIADNCDDNTAAVARAAGALVFERSDISRRGKGQALDWFLSKHSKDYAEFDIVAIVDADTLVHHDYLHEIAASLSHPDVRVVQSHNGVSNPEDNWRTALSTAAFNVFNHIRPAGRNVIGGTAGLKGNGMAFRAEVLRKHGWPAHSIVEDIEFTLQLLDDNILVHYNPDALVVSEMAVERKQVETQRKRWEGGRFQMFRQHSPIVLGKYIQTGKMRYLDELMELLTPPLSFLLIMQFILFAGALLMYTSWIPIFLATFTVEVFYVLSGQILRKAPLSLWMYLLAAPLFLMSKVPVYLKLIKREETKQWDRTERISELNSRERIEPDEN